MSEMQESIQSEHLKRGGEMITQWLTWVINCILDLETICKPSSTVSSSQSTKEKAVTPFHVAAIMAYHWSQPWLRWWNLSFWTGYSPSYKSRECPTSSRQHIARGQSCADAIFVNMESIMHYTNQGDRIYMCAYDLENAFTHCGIRYSDETHLQCWH